MCEPRASQAFTAATSSSPKKDSGLQPILDLRHLNHALMKRSFKDDHFETDPLTNMPRGLVYVTGSKRRILSHPDSPPSQMILEICIRRGGLSIPGCAVWAVPGSPHFYTMHGCGSLPSFKEDTAHSLKAFQKMLGLVAAASPILQLGLLRMWPIQFWLKQRVPAAAWWLFYSLNVSFCFLK